MGISATEAVAVEAEAVEARSAIVDDGPAGKILNPDLRNDAILQFEQQLRSKIIGQAEAVAELVKTYQLIKAGLLPHGRPLATLLMTGTSGVGKTRLVEAMAEILFKSPQALIKIDCAEYQHGHEISKLLGAPPSFLGHRETAPLLSEARIKEYRTDADPYTLLLFDEIEKANDSLYNLLLGILDKGIVTLGDNNKVDLSKCIIFMTSNLGSREMSALADTDLGFAPKKVRTKAELEDDKAAIGLAAAKRKFLPEFVNRLDKILIFKSLTATELGEVLGLELDRVQDRITLVYADRQFVFGVLPSARDFLLDKGTDRINGARELKRVIEKYIVYPLSSLLSTNQIAFGDRIDIYRLGKQDKLTFKTRGAVGPVLDKAEDAPAPTPKPRTRLEPKKRTTQGVQ